MWIETAKELPPEGKYVLARHTRGTWHDSTDSTNVNCVVVKLEKGISMKERASLPTGDPRARIYLSSDQAGNNEVPYSFAMFGPDHFFGQDISHWQAIEPLE